MRLVLVLYVQVVVWLMMLDNRWEDIRWRQGSGERGQSTVEYAVAVALLVVATMAGIQVLTGGVSGIFNRLVSRLQGL